MKKLIVAGLLIAVIACSYMVFFKYNDERLSDVKEKDKIIIEENNDINSEIMKEATNEVIDHDDNSNKSKSESIKKEPPQEVKTEKKETTYKQSESKKEETSSNSSNKTNNKDDVVIEQPKKEEIKTNPWDELGISEEEYNYSPMWKWQEITFGIYKNYSYKCSSKNECFSMCTQHGNNMLESNDGSYTYNEVISYSGKYLGEQFIFKTLES